MGRIDVYPSGTGLGTTNIYQQPEAPSPVINNLWVDTDEGSGGVGLSSIIGYAEITSSSTSATAGNTVDVPGLEVTVTVPAGRRLRITGKFIGYANTLPARVASTIREGAAVLGNFEAQPTQAGFGAGLHSEAIISPSAGTHTYKLSITAATNTGFVYVDSSLKGWLLVEDITGTLWPAGQSIGAGTIASEQWIAWTPTVINVTMGASVATGRYFKIGRFVRGVFKLVLGAGFSFTGEPRFLLPTAMGSSHGAEDFLSSATFLDYGTAVLGGFVEWDSANGNALIRPWVVSGTYLTFGQINNTVPFTWAVNDVISCGFTYEAAT